MKDGFNKKGLCRLCKDPRTDEGHDPCIANLPGVLYACCGHGIENGYIKFTDGRVLNFTPINVNLDLPTHFIARRATPIWVKGDKYSMLDFKTREKKKITSTSRVFEDDDQKIFVRPQGRNVE